MRRFWLRCWLAAWTLGLAAAAGATSPGEAERLRLTGRPIHLLIGGFHLLHADAAQVDDVAARLQALGVERVAPSHCTGAAAIARFRRAWGPRFVEGGLGAVLEVPLK